MDPSGEYVIGIDTGGTYTDGVLLDHRSRKVMAFSKTLTTRDNLARGIKKALTELRIADPSSIRLVGISSTLATNSIAEGKTRRVGLLLIGYDRELMATYNLASKLPTRHFAHFRGGHTTQGLEKEALDLKSIETWIAQLHSELDALAISSYFSPLNPSHEERALERVRNMCALPVVLGNQLSKKLDSIKRATTACLNASLVAVMQEFIEAVRKSLVAQGIRAPLMIVKGDGSLMPYKDAVHKPVETVLSGPAASAIGGRFLSGHGSALVIDVGGTTTDMALMDDFKVTLSEDGARVGTFETAVEAARIRTTALGCDSRIRFEAGETVQVGPDRVVPLALLAARFPRVEKEIRDLKKKGELERRATDIEYWILAKTIGSQKQVIANTNHQKLITLLEDGPLSLTQLLKKMDVYHALQLNADALIQQGVIEQATLTPTDLLHVTGQMDIWCGEAARQAVEFACGLHDRNQAVLVEQTLDAIIVTMVKQAIVFLGRQDGEDLLSEQVDGSWGPWFVREALTQKSPYLAVTMTSRFPIIGIGAPAKIFIQKVAEYLNTRFILPDHAPVANAVGAVAGSVVVAKEALVYARETDGARVFMAQIEGSNKRFVEVEDACRYAEKIVAQLARESVIAAGAIAPQVVIEKQTEGALLRIVAHAAGNPRLSDPQGNYAL
ncbi:MAG: hydantoinase/oxoprolinase family protein [Desulfobacterales bacterium]|jgi:N-methylhydantoinase A/oxoprolinase/acetone carboxylase beta subunit